MTQNKMRALQESEVIIYSRIIIISVKLVALLEVFIMQTMVGKGK